MGGIRELMALSIPMILSALSANFMIFIDRLMLAYYSTEAMNSVGASSTTFLVFSITILAITSIAEVFAGQSNGKKQYKKVAIPIWQMIWLSLFSGILFIIVSIFFSSYLIPKELHNYGLPYFKILMNFGFLTPLIAAISGFYIGIGKTRIITYVVLLGNIINFILDYILIFGVGNYLYPMGTEGAAYATVCSEIVQTVLLFAIFFKKVNREKYNTHKFQFNFSYFKKCFKIGLPGAISHASELSAWAVMYYLVTIAGNFYLTSLTIGQNIFMLFMFTIDGLEKGIISIVANLIGSKKYKYVYKMIRSSFIFHGSVTAILAFPLLFYPEIMISFFDIDDFSGAGKAQLISYLVGTLRFVWLYYAIDSVVWIYAGVLTASGDTRFLMAANSTCCWLFGVLPFYIFVNHLNLVNPSYTFGFLCCYAVINLMLIYYRFRVAIWKKMKI